MDRNFSDYDLPQTFTTDIDLHDKATGHNKRNKHHHPEVKRTVKYLAVAPSYKAYSAALRGAPDEVVRTIANAAYNVERGDLQLSPAEKKLFAQHRKAIATITSPKVSLARKRKEITSQKGGFPFIPLIIGSALGALGSFLFGKKE